MKKGIEIVYNAEIWRKFFEDIHGKKSILFIWATNRIAVLDKAILRAGKFDFK